MGASDEPVFDVKVEPTPEPQGAEAGQPTEPAVAAPPASSSSSSHLTAAVAAAFAIPTAKRTKTEGDEGNA